MHLSFTIKTFQGGFTLHATTKWDYVGICMGQVLKSPPYRKFPLNLEEGTENPFVSPGILPLQEWLLL